MSSLPATAAFVAVAVLGSLAIASVAVRDDRRSALASAVVGYCPPTGLGLTVASSAADRGSFSDSLRGMLSRNWRSATSSLFRKEGKSNLEIISKEHKQHVASNAKSAGWVGNLAGEPPVTI